MRVRDQLPALLMLLSCTAGSSQRIAAKWAEYVFAKDGFAITSPTAPNPHPETQLGDATAYTVHFPATNEGITLRVLHQPHECATYLGELKRGVLARKQAGVNPSSLKDISISGCEGVQYESKLNPDRVLQERYYCIKNRFYAFAIIHSAHQSLSADATRLLDSFHLISDKP
jgi:hypothetical protein